VKANRIAGEKLKAEEQIFAFYKKPVT